MRLFLHKKRKSFIKILAPIGVSYITLKLLLLPAQLILLHCGIPDSRVAFVPDYYMSLIKCKFIPPHEKLQKKKLELLFQSKDCKKYILNVLLFLTTQRFSFVYILQSIKVKDCITYYPSIHPSIICLFIHSSTDAANHPGIRLPPGLGQEGSSLSRGPQTFLFSQLFHHFRVRYWGIPNSMKTQTLTLVWHEGELNLVSRQRTHVFVRCLFCFIQLYHTYT